MRCINPRKASINSEGGISHRYKDAIPGLVPFTYPCGKCLACRLNKAREKAIRSVHEAKMHEDNIFLTLTYSDENLESPKLIYKHWQKFIQDLRDQQNHKPIGYMVTGEYGDLNKRPHWHAILFNYAPSDRKLDRTTERQEQIYTSETLTNLWNKGKTEYGSVTMDSAGYVARYSAKKLVHGYDGHEYEPIHKTSSKHAIGKKWIEQNYKHTLENGLVYLPNGSPSKIPRYYLDWAKKNQPQYYQYYLINVLPRIIKLTEEQNLKEETQYLAQAEKTFGNKTPYPTSRSKVKETILQLKFKRLQEKSKL